MAPQSRAQHFRDATARMHRDPENKVLPCGSSDIFGHLQGTLNSTGMNSVLP